MTYFGGRNTFFQKTVNGYVFWKWEIVFSNRLFRWETGTSLVEVFLGGETAAREAGKTDRVDASRQVVR